MLQTAAEYLDFNLAAGSVNGTKLNFSPGGKQLGWSIHRFPGTEADVPLSVGYYCSNLFPDDEFIYLALANYATQRWEIISAAAVQTLNVPLQGDASVYRSPDNSIYVAVMAYGTIITLDAVEVQYQNRTPALPSWPFVGADTQHSSRSAHVAVGHANPQWHIETGAFLFGSGVTVGAAGELYICGLLPDDHGVLLSFNPDGTPRWDTQLLDRALTSPAIDLDGRVFVGTWASELNCFSQAGDPIWKYDAEGNIEASAVIGPDSTIYSASVQGFRVFALKRDGSERWHHDLDGGVRSSPALDGDGNLYVATVQGDLTCIDSDGTPSWTHLGDGEVNGAVVLNEAAGRAYYGTSSGKFYAVNLADGSPAGSSAPGGMFMGGPALAADGTLFACNSDGLVYKFDASAAVTDSFDSGDPFNTTPVIDGANTVFTANSTGRLLSLSPELDVNWEFALGGEVRAPLTIGPLGELYVPVFSGTLWCFAPSVDVPAKPTGLAATDATFSGKIELSWNEQLDANGYEIYRDAEATPLATVGFVTSYADETVPDTNPHSYAIKAINELGSSELSDPDDGSLKVTVSGAGEWDQFGGDAAHSCRVSVAGPHTLNIAWTYTLPGFCYTCPVVGIDGEIYVASTNQDDDQGYVTCVNPDMSLRWESPLPQGEYPRFALAIAADGTLYVPTDLRLLTLDPDGEEGWSFTGSEGQRAFNGIAIDSNGLLYVTTEHPVNGKWTFCLNGAGEEQWKIHKASTYCVPAIGSDGRVFITDNSYAVRSFLSDGSESFVYGITETVEHSVTIGLDAVNGDTLYCTGNGLLFCYDVDTNTENWRYPEMGSDYLFGVAALSPADDIFTGGGEGMFKIISDGSLGWQNADMATPPTNQCMVIDKDGYAYLGDFTDKFYCINPDGTTQWSDTVGGTRYASPAIGPEGNVYIATQDGKLRCYSIAP